MSMETNPPVANSTAPGAPAAAPGTSRPDVQTYRAMQSMNARIQAMGSQLQQMQGFMSEQQRVSAEQADQAFRDGVKARLESGEISAADAALEVAERVAQRRQLPAPGPQPPQVNPEQVQQRIGAEAILRGFGLTGEEGGLDYSSPRALVDSAQRFLAARAQAQGVDHDDLVAEAARRQGMVIPHRDGGRPTSMNQPVTHGDVQRLAWSYNPKRNPPARLRAQIEAMRAGRGTVAPTGESGYAATPDNYARINSGQTPR